MKNWLNSAVGWTALVVALGGTALAATRLPARSVGTRQLRSHAVTTAKVARGAIDATRLAPQVLAAIGTQADIETVTSSGGSGPPSCVPNQNCDNPTPAGTSRSYSVPCPAGTTLLSGGFEIDSENTEVVESMPDQQTASKWGVVVQLTADSRQPPSAVIEVLCAKAPSR